MMTWVFFFGGRWEGSAPPATDVTWYYISAMDAMHQVRCVRLTQCHMLSMVAMTLGIRRSKRCSVRTSFLAYILSKHACLHVLLAYAQKIEPINEGPPQPTPGLVSPSGQPDDALPDRGMRAEHLRHELGRWLCDGQVRSMHGAEFVQCQHGMTLFMEVQIINANLVLCCAGNSSRSGACQTPTGSSRRSLRSPT